MNLEIKMKHSQGPGSNDPNMDTITFERALAETCERYPMLAEQIQRSLETPQLGQYHNEGPTMDYHLALILENLESVKNNDARFTELIQDDDLQTIFREVVVRQNEDDPEKLVVNPNLIPRIPRGSAAGSPLRKV
jgi:hypothetical protein